MTENPRTAGLQKWTMRLVRWLFAAALLTGACSPRKQESEADKLRRIAIQADLALPSGTRILHFDEPDYIVDPVWAAKLEIPTTSYELFSAAMAAKRSDPTSVSGRFAMSVAWWQPQETKLLKQYLANPQTLVNVVIAMEGTKLVAYVECMVF